MDSEPTQERSQPSNTTPPSSDDSRAGGSAEESREATRKGDGAPENGANRDNEQRGDKQAKPAAKPVVEAKVRMQKRLPALDDDADVGVQKDQIVTRDGKADLGFTGVLQASAAPQSAPQGHWQEYRVYLTDGGKHVFSKVNRTIFAESDDAYEADVFDPSPSSVPTQLLRGAREIARSRPLTWMDAAVAFFGYDPLAKVLYRKLSARFEEQIS